MTQLQKILLAIVTVIVGVQVVDWSMPLVKKIVDGYCRMREEDKKKPEPTTAVVQTQYVTPSMLPLTQIKPPTTYSWNVLCQTPEEISKLPAMARCRVCMKIADVRESESACCFYLKPYQAHKEGEGQFWVLIPRDVYTFNTRTLKNMIGKTIEAQGKHVPGQGGSQVTVNDISRLQILLDPRELLAERDEG